MQVFYQFHIWHDLLHDLFNPQIQTFIKDLTEITNEIKRHESAAAPNPQLLGLGKT